MNYQGFVYLVQPSELIGTDRYKIGMSKNKKADYSRLISYGKKCEVLYIHNCDNPLRTERKLKKKFNDKFNLIARTEYFRGNKETMISLCDELFNNDNYANFYNKNIKNKKKIREKKIRKKKIRKKNNDYKKTFFLNEFLSKTCPNEIINATKPLSVSESIEMNKR